MQHPLQPLARSLWNAAGGHAAAAAATRCATAVGAHQQLVTGTAAAAAAAPVLRQSGTATQPPLRALLRSGVSAGPAPHAAAPYQPQLWSNQSGTGVAALPGGVGARRQQVSGRGLTLAGSLQRQGQQGRGGSYGGSGYGGRCWGAARAVHVCGQAPTATLLARGSSHPERSISKAAGRRLLLPALGHLVILGGSGWLLYYSLYQAEAVQVPYTGRVAIVSPAIADVFAKAADELIEMISVSREQQGKSWVVPDHARAPRLKRQLAALVKAAADGPGGDGAHGHVRRLEWELFITCIEEEMPFIGAATPAGKVLLSSFYLKHLAFSDGELDAILAHEVAHGQAHHMPEMATTHGSFVGLYFLSSAFLSTVTGLRWRGQILYCLSYIVAAWLLRNALSRRNEYEADAIGMRLMARAGMDPRGMVALMERLERMEQEVMGPRGELSTPLLLISTHPFTRDRLRAVREQLPRALEEYHSSRRKQQRLMALARKLVPLSLRAQARPPYRPGSTVRVLLGQQPPTAR